MNEFIQRVAIPICFPAGVRMGAGKGTGNLLVQARDGQGHFVLRGSALAGAVRHAIESSNPEGKELVADWFGSQRASDGDLVPSRLKFADSRLFFGHSATRGIRVRTHNAIDRHRGAPIDGGLFSMESLPAGTTATLLITVESTTEEAADAKEMLQRIAGLFDQGITLGGSAARGIGLARLNGQPSLKSWNLIDLDMHADWLDHCVQQKEPSHRFSGETLAPVATDQNRLSIALDLGIPRGQDFVVADGQGIECDMEPQRIRNADGSTAWLLPGSTLRGIFRAYVARLAARDGKPVADSYQRWKGRNVDPGNVLDLTGEDLAFGFASDQERVDLTGDPDAIECPVMRLFGSAYAKGRIHIADAISHEYSENDAQERVHVAIDRFSGGANEGFLFDNKALTRGDFTVRITIQNPVQEEVRWIAGCIRALDMGLIRVGSAKGSGRLALRQPPTAEGPHAALITAVHPLEASHG